MLRIFRFYLERLDSTYRDRLFFVGLKARLLAAIALLVVIFIPFNIAKVIWTHPPLTAPRIVVNLILEIACLLSLRSVLKGQLDRAANGLALAMTLTIHGAVLLIRANTNAVPLQPLSVGIQFFAFNIVMLLFAIVFASRRIATAVFSITVAGHIGFYLLILQ